MSNIDKEALFEEAKTFDEEHATRIVKLQLYGVDPTHVDLILLRYVKQCREIAGMREYLPENYKHSTKGRKPKASIPVTAEATVEEKPVEKEIFFGPGANQPDYSKPQPN